jgi:quercetin dioxygenase-like cupin family protein
MQRFLRSLILFASLWAPAAARGAVPVAEEPHHHPLLHTPVAEIFDVVVPPNAVMALHAHPTDHLALVLEPARLRNEVEGAAPVDHRTGDVGTVVFVPAGPPHRQINIGTTTGRWIAVELAPRGSGEASGALGEAGPPFVRVLDNDAVRLDRLILDPGKEAPASPFSKPYLLVVIRGGEIVEVPDSGRGAMRLPAGTVRWVEEASSGTWRHAGGAGTGAFEALYLQVR